jgi:pimeloyl-ACP methyl ester carboxylesterase/SAM-dependent methyltransferase
MSNEMTVHANGVDLCVQTFGDPGTPALLLIGGAAASMDWWEDGFCERLAAGLRFVIRYDSRDTGRSTNYPPGAPPYSGLDLAADALGVLDALAVERAHLIGISMGGALAQRLAFDHPGRVASVTLVSTSPAGPSRTELPAMSEELRERFARTPTAPDWTDRAAVIEHIVEEERPFMGPAAFDEAHLRALAARIFDRTNDIEASFTNHWVIDDGDPDPLELSRVTAPALIVHGTADPLFPYGHGEALARELPDARLLPLEGVGHQMPPEATWDTVIPAILLHTSGSWDEHADRVAARSLAAGDPTGWFDRLYSAADAGEVAMPWDRLRPHPLLAGWASDRGLSGDGRRAVVVGSGLGADAEFVAGLGFDTVGFDVAETAVRLARRRFPDSHVHYTTADLLDPPPEWLRAFDLVVDVFTVQALPDPPRDRAIVNVGRLVAPGGTLVVVAAVRDEHDPYGQGPPWPLTRAEIEAFATDGLVTEHIERTSANGQQDAVRWRAEFSRPRQAGGPGGETA